MVISSFCRIHLNDNTDDVFLIVYPDGRVCISILHAPGDDPMGYETSAERWSPVQSVEKILLSVVSILAGSFSFLLHMCSINTLELKFIRVGRT